MCMMKTPNVPEVETPTRYAQQRTPNRGDTGSAKERATVRRKRATGTILTQNVSAVDGEAKKTLLGA